jgi:TorA maturation chaperone TorD
MNPDLFWQRVGMYSLLRRLYTYPLDEESVTAVMSLSPDEIAMDSSMSDERLIAYLTTMQQWLTSQKFGKRIESLNIEMTRLLEGPGRPVTPPYASYYLSGGQLMGPPAYEALATYQKWGVTPADGLRTVPADHLALELGFLAHLARIMATETAFLGETARASDHFLRRNLLPWWPRFYKDLCNGTDVSFFIGLAGFTDAAIEMDAACLRTLLNRPTPVFAAASELALNHA